VEIRLPHPQGTKPKRVRGGRYDAATESVHFENFRGSAKTTLEF
jgi:hypothetical protein